MPVATKNSSSSHQFHHRTQVYDPYPLRYQVYECGSNSTLSVSSEGVEKHVVGGLRRVRAKATKNSPEEPRSRDLGAMTSHPPRRTYSESRKHAKEVYGKEPGVVIREVRRKSDSEHRHHHRRCEKEDTRDGKVYVSKAHRKSEGEADRSRPNDIRRSTTNAGESSRTKHERHRTGDRELQRKCSEKRPSRHEEKVHTSLRREQRSIANLIPKDTRGRAPVTRYIYIPSKTFYSDAYCSYYRSASVRETITKSFFGPPSRRSQTPVRQARPPSFTQPKSPPVRDKLERAPSTTRGGRPAGRPSSIIDAIFRVPIPVKSPVQIRPPKPEQQ